MIYLYRYTIITDDIPKPNDILLSDNIPYNQ